MKCTLTPYLTTAFAQRVAAGDPVKDREHLQRRKNDGATSPTYYLPNCSVISGGANNTIAAHYASIPIVSINCACNSVISGGCNNFICACNAAIGGGYNNCVFGDHSAILGGDSNTVTHNWAGAFGRSVASNQDCAFHANVLVTQNPPLLAGFPPSGTVAYITVNAALAGAGFGFTLGDRIAMIA